MRSLFFPLGWQPPDLREEQRLLFSQLLVPKLFGFAWLPRGKPAPLAEGLVVPNLGETGKGWFGLLPFLLALRSEGVQLPRPDFLQVLRGSPAAAERVGARGVRNRAAGRYLMVSLQEIAVCTSGEVRGTESWKGVHLLCQAVPKRMQLQLLKKNETILLLVFNMLLN